MPKHRRLMVLAVAALWLAAQGSRAAGDGGPDTPEALAWAAWAASAARPLELKLAAWAQISDEYWDLNALYQAGRKLGDRLDAVPGAPPPAYREEEGLRSLAWTAPAGEGRQLEVTVQTVAAVPGAGNNEAGTYVLINMTGPLAGEPAATWRRRVEEALAALGGEPRVSIYLTGTLPGRLGQEAQAAVAEAMLKAAGARPVEGVREPDLVSLTGYRPGAPYVRSAGRPVNLNVALRYHASEGLTYVEVGSPLLDGEY